MSFRRTTGSPVPANWDDIYDMLKNSAVHVMAIVTYVSALNAIFTGPETVVSKSYGSHFQFLTILGVFISLGANAAGLVYRLTGSVIFKLLRDTLNVVSAPLEMLIAILYWTIKSIDPNLMMDPELQGILPDWIDRSIHVYPVIFQTIDVVVFTPPWKLGNFSALIIYGVIASIYWGWIQITYLHNGFYPYPFLSLLTPIQRYGFVAFATVLVTIMFAIIKTLQRVNRRFQLSAPVSLADKTK